MVFRLDQVNPLLLEQIITKFNGDSYFLLQQTCRWVNEFVQSNRMISVHLDGRYTQNFKPKDDLQLGNSYHYWTRFFQFQFNRKRKTNPELVCRLSSALYQREGSIERFYGTRLRTLSTDEVGKTYKKLCDCLEKNNITCTELRMYWSELTKKQCSTLFDILKPSMVEMDSGGSDRYQALLQSNTLKKVEVYLDSDILETAATKLLSMFENVKITVRDNSAQLPLIRTILQAFQSKPFPKLRKFHFYVWGKDILPSKEYLVEELFDSNLTIEEAGKGEITASMETPRHFPSGASCEVHITGGANTHSNVYYAVEGEISSS